MRFSTSGQWNRNLIATYQLLVVSSRKHIIVLVIVNITSILDDNVKKLELIFQTT